MSLSASQRDAIEILAGLCTSCKEAPTLTQLLRDYTEMEGKQLDYTGFRSITDFLQASNRFYVFNRNGMWIVNAKLTAESAHIALLVGKQKSTKSKAKSRSMGLPARDGLFYHAAAPRKRYNPTYRYAQGKTSGPFQNAPRNIQPAGTVFPNNTRTVSKKSLGLTITSGRGDFGRTVQRQFLNTAPLPSQLAKVIHPGVQNTAPIQHATSKFEFPPKKAMNAVPAQREKVTVPPNRSKVSVSNVSQKPLPKIIVVQQPPSIPFSNIQSTKSSEHSAQLKAPIEKLSNEIPQEKELATVLAICRPVSPYENAKESKETQENENASFKINKPLLEKSLDPNGSNKRVVRHVSSAKTDLLVSKYSVQERLGKIKLSMPEETYTPVPPVVADKEVAIEENTTATIVPLEWWDTGDLNNEERLQEYCVIKRLPPPEFKYFTVKNGKYKRYQCRCTINGLTYTTYPDDFDSKEKSREVCAAHAVVDIKNQEQLSQFPEYQGEPYDIASKIYDIVSNSRSGVFLKEIPNIFREKYNFSIPPNFVQIMTVEFSSWFVFENHLTLQQQIIYPGQRSLVSMELSSAASDITDVSILPPKITMPWNEKNWNVLVTFPEKPTSVWVNLLGPDYFDALVELRIKMNEILELEEPENIVIGECYIAVLHKMRERVRVIKKDSEANKYLMHFIDTGEHDVLDVSVLYECKAEFLELPPQAFSISLREVSLFDNVDEVYNWISEIYDKVLVAEVHTSQNQYRNNGNVIEVTLYDTSTDIDVNVNDKLFGSIAEKFVVPTKLHSKGCNVVTITTILDSGLVVCYLKVNGYIDFIKEEIRRIVANNEHLEKHIGQVNHNDPDEVYLVWNRATHTYVRAKVISSTNAFDSKDVVVHLIDYGTFLSVDKHSEIFQIKSFSKCLTILPPQAIKMKLHDVENTGNAHVVSLIRGYLKPDTVLLVKVIEENIEPSVLIYRRLADNKLHCLNEDIKAQASLSLQND
ncbi:tudor domain-containing protein 7-like [Culicoides brevitarsis]|uniref:tudor domain-containing protein 7-like n=1 Tax=Culicoides brevitarsis TaxID=469753 RepID=UPI00307C0487